MIRQTLNAEYGQAGLEVRGNGQVGLHVSDEFASAYLILSKTEFEQFVEMGQRFLAENSEALW